MEISLDQEKFKGIKELAEISTQISKARATLTELNAAKDSFLEERADEFRQRVELLLVESEDFLRQVSANHEVLIHYRNEVTAFAEEVSKFYEGVVAFRTASSADFEKGLKLLDEKLAVVRGERAKLNEQQRGLDAQRAQDDVLRAKLRDDQRRVKDDEQRLAAAWAELKANSK